MRPIHLNLASRPYRDYRPVYLVAGIAGLITAILMVYNMQTAWRYLVETKQTRAQIATIEEDTANEKATAKALDAQLAKIDVRTLDSQARYINLQIRERAFSWSALMERLENVLPGDVRLLELNPTVEETGEVSLILSCATRKPDGMIVLIDRLFADPKFRNAFPSSIRTEQDGTKSFSVQVTYLPDAPEVKR